jgi:hypothetical protein
MNSISKTNDSIARRDFLKQTLTLTSGVAILGSVTPLRAAKSPNDKALVGVGGFHNRGMDHLAGYLALPNVEAAYVCDVDSHMLDKTLAAVAQKQQRKPKAVKDLRRQSLSFQGRLGNSGRHRCHLRLRGQVPDLGRPKLRSARFRKRPLRRELLRGKRLHGHCQQQCQGL